MTVIGAFFLLEALAGPAPHPRRNPPSGVLFLIVALRPLYLIALVIAKALKFFSSVGGAFAEALGMKSILGAGGATIVSGLLT